MAFEEIVAAWKAGRTVQYLVVIGYDDDWTDYTGITKPQEQSSRLAWRVKPTHGVTASRQQPSGGKPPMPPLQGAEGGGERG